MNIGSKIDRKCYCIYIKKDAIKVASAAWTDGIQAEKKNILSGFEVSEIWPLNVTAMQARLKLFQQGGINLKKVEPVPWITCHEVI